MTEASERDRSPQATRGGMEERPEGLPAPVRLRCAFDSIRPYLPGGRDEGASIGAAGDALPAEGERKERPGVSCGRIGRAQAL